MVDKAQVEVAKTVAEPIAAAKPSILEKTVIAVGPVLVPLEPMVTDVSAIWAPPAGVTVTSKYVLVLVDNAPILQAAPKLLVPEAPAYPVEALVVEINVVVPLLLPCAALKVAETMFTSLPEVGFTLVQSQM
jgi:hypothetical protein